MILQFYYTPCYLQFEDVKLLENAYGTLLKQTCLKCDYMRKDIFQQLQKGSNVQGICPPVP